MKQLLDSVKVVLVLGVLAIATIPAQVALAGLCYDPGGTFCESGSGALYKYRDSGTLLN